MRLSAPWFQSQSAAARAKQPPGSVTPVIAAPAGMTQDPPKPSLGARPKDSHSSVVRAKQPLLSELPVVAASAVVAQDSSAPVQEARAKDTVGPAQLSPPSQVPLPSLVIPARPIMSRLHHDQNGITVRQMDCNSSDLVLTYLEYSDKDIWIPWKLFMDQDFIQDFMSQAPTRQTALSFSRVNRMGFEQIPLPEYLPGLERFLGRLQRGERTIAHIYCGQCPHIQCRRFLTNQDTGHYCVAKSGQFTDHHVGRAKLVEYGHLQA